MPKGIYNHIKGMKRSEATKVKMRKTHAGNKNPAWKGGISEQKFCINCEKPLVSYYAKRCRDCSDQAKCGENHWNWKGGFSPNLYPKEFNPELKLKIRVRDNFACCLCGRTEREELEELNYVLCVNHIDFDKNNCKEENLNTLCRRCNVKINRNRDYWTNYFQRND